VCGLRAYVFQIFFGLPQWFIEAFGANKLLKGLQLIRPKSRFWQTVVKNPSTPGTVDFERERAKLFLVCSFETNSGGPRDLANDFRHQVEFC
jgi:hypothetical protein